MIRSAASPAPMAAMARPARMETWKTVKAMTRFLVPELVLKHAHRRAESGCGEGSKRNRTTEGEGGLGREAHSLLPRPPENASKMRSTQPPLRRQRWITTSPNTMSPGPDHWPAGDRLGRPSRGRRPAMEVAPLVSISRTRRSRSGRARNCSPGQL
jgi:hypothetical protein